MKVISFIIKQLLMSYPGKRGDYLFQYIPGVGKVLAAVSNTGPMGATGSPPPAGNTLTVDAVYGNDTTAASDRYSKPFLTISAAMALATGGQLVVINPGTYNESIVVPANVSLKGAGAQSVIIQKLGVTADTTLVTMGVNSRVEDFTANLSSSGNFNLVGAYFPGATPTTAKLRNSIWTITSTATGSPSVVGVLADGATASPTTAFVTANAIQRSSINVISSSTGVSRGIYITGANRFPVRDIVVNARGTGTNIVGVETTHVNAFADIKTTTISGTLYDINRTLGNIQLGFTDLVNANANGNSFTVLTEPAPLQFSVSGNINTQDTHYLLPGTSTYAGLQTTPIGIPFLQKVIVFQLLVSATSVLPTGAIITVNLYKNTVGTPFISGVINNGTRTVRSLSTSANFTTSDVIIVEFVTTGNSVGTIPIFVSCSIY